MKVAMPHLKWLFIFWGLPLHCQTTFPASKFFLILNGNLFSCYLIHYFGSSLLHLQCDSLLFSKLNIPCTFSSGSVSRPVSSLDMFHLVDILFKWWWCPEWVQYSRCILRKAEQGGAFTSLDLDTLHSVKNCWILGGSGFYLWNQRLRVEFPTTFLRVSGFDDRTKWHSLFQFSLGWQGIIGECCLDMIYSINHLQIHSKEASPSQYFISLSIGIDVNAVYLPLVFRGLTCFQRNFRL